MMEERIEKAMEAVCDLCHWPYVYRDSEVMYAEKCDTCPMLELLSGEQGEDMAFQIKRTNTYIEHDIVVGGVVIGSAEIEPNEKELSRLAIFEPYQNRGYGTRAVKELISRYGVRTLWVRSDNQRAIHVYEKCGFRKSGETMFEMELKLLNGEQEEKE